MADLNPQARTVLARYWSEIFGGAANRLTTAALFGNIRQRAETLGLGAVGVAASTVSTLRGYAGRMIASAGRLNKALDSNALTSDHYAEAPWARPLGEQNTMPIYHVSFDHTIENDAGETVVKRQTIILTGVLPGTVGDLRDLVSSEAQLLAAEGSPDSEGTPHGTSLGVDNLMLTAV